MFARADPTAGLPVQPTEDPALASDPGSVEDMPEAQGTSGEEPSESEDDAGE